MSNFKIIDNSDQFQNAEEGKKEQVLEEWGLLAEGYAKRLCPVDTGRLRNSISHDKDDDAAYIGTNVEYAPYVELGTSKRKAKPYLKPAIADHTNEYEQVAKRILTS